MAGLHFQFVSPRHRFGKNRSWHRPVAPNGGWPHARDVCDFPHLAYGTPRKLPKPGSLPGRVVVLDVAFAANAGGASFEKTTLPFIEGLGSRLAMWVDHHDHDRHSDYADDPRFVLRTKAQHGACPEMVTPERVAAAGPVDTICCHLDFDGLCSAAKWIRAGVEPYEGADDDARAIDTRMGEPTERARVLDRALRGRPRDEALRGLMVRYLADGATDASIYREFQLAAETLHAREREAKRLAAVLTAFRAPEAISDQHLHQLWKHPEDSLAICPLLPSAPEAEPQNCSAQPAETLYPPLDLDLFAVSFLDDKGKKSI